MFLPLKSSSIACLGFHQSAGTDENTVAVFYILRNQLYKSSTILIVAFTFCTILVSDVSRFESGFDSIL